MNTVKTTLRKAAGAAMWLVLLSCAGWARASGPANGEDVWKKAGADDGLRQAFERAIYSFKDSGHGIWRGENDAQRLSLEFDSGEAKLSHPDGSVRFHLNGYGYGDKLRKPMPARLTGVGNRLEYQRGDLTEWYVNGAQGLEQGFTMARRPPGDGGDGPLTIALGVTGDLALGEKDGAAVLESGEGVVLRYAGLTASDARGRTLPSRLEVSGREIRLIVEDRAAQYPVVIDPTWSQQAELTASDGAEGDVFGISVSVSGGTAVIGAESHQVGGNAGQGAAYVFVQSGTTWSQQAELTASDGAASDLFGVSVSVSGGTAVIGAEVHQVGANSRQGAAYVFVQSGTTWSQQAELTASDGAPEDSFGVSVSVSGGTAVIGAYIHQVGSNIQQGAAYVFVQSGTTWSQQAELTASDGAPEDSFGVSVSVSEGTAVIGAEFHQVGGNSEQGAAYVFVQSGTTWSQQAELTASDGAADDFFGTSVSVSGDTAVIGADFHQVGANTAQGAAYVFVQSGATWSQQAELTAPDGAANDTFGISVSVSGGTAVIGADSHQVGANIAQGVAYVFVQSGTTWSQQAELTASDGDVGDQFGSSVSVSGGTAVIGTFRHASTMGAAYVFVAPASLSISAAHSSPIYQGGPGAITLTVSNAGAATAATATVSDAIDPSFTINSASSSSTSGACSNGGQNVTCTIAAGTSFASIAFTVYVTASATAGSSISNSATLTDSGDTVTTGTANDTITVSPQAPQVDPSLSQQALSGSTDNGTCAAGNRTLTATDMLQNTSGTTLTNPYAGAVTLTQGDTLLSQSASSASVAPSADVTFTFHIQLANCNTFQLGFDVNSN